MKRIIMAALALALVLTLAACQCDHQWTEADCLTPKTCAKCGETEGEPLGHDWMDATCQAPETCTRCGLTQGAALDHSWKEANYQDPETCTTCGATQGQPLEADFEKHGLEINLWENKHVHDDGSVTYTDPEDGFPYVTTCYNDVTKKTTGALYLYNYRIFQSDETHQAVDGYEWRALDMKIVFSDGNAWSSGINLIYTVENYYAIEDWENSESDLTGTQWEYLLDLEDLEEAFCYTISFHGEMLPMALVEENVGFDGWQTGRNEEDGTVTHTATWTRSCYACVPIGYDGVVIGFSDSGVAWEDGMYIYDVANETTLFFRLGQSRPE